MIKNLYPACNFITKGGLFIDYGDCFDSVISVKYL